MRGRARMPASSLCNDSMAAHVTAKVLPYGGRVVDFDGISWRGTRTGGIATTIRVCTCESCPNWVHHLIPDSLRNTVLKTKSKISLNPTYLGANGSNQALKLWNGGTRTNIRLSNVLKPSEGGEFFSLMILPRKGCEKEHDLSRGIQFATNIPRRFVVWNLRRIPDDYGGPRCPGRRRPEPNDETPDSGSPPGRERTGVIPLQGQICR